MGGILDIPPQLGGLLGLPAAPSDGGLLGGFPQAAQPPQPQPDFYARNKAWVRPGDHIYNTPLPASQEQAFRSWLGQNQVPFDPNKGVTDYDMRGFWKALQAGDPKAQQGIDPNDQQMHYPDYWKTPYHQTFSAESQWATPNAPHWTEDDKLIDAQGNVIYDDRAANQR